MLPNLGYPPVKLCPRKKYDVRLFCVVVSVLYLKKKYCSDKVMSLVNVF